MKVGDGSLDGRYRKKCFMLSIIKKVDFLELIKYNEFVERKK